MISEQDFSIFLAALRFSSEKHRSHRRKDAERTPYINHPIQVAELLWSVGGIREMPILVAALLHDTIEDTDTSPGEIRSQFGQTVLDYVLEVSDDKSLPSQERKRLQIEKAAKKTPPAKCIKLADFICNLRDLHQSPPEGWSLERIQEYIRWSEKVAKGLRGINPGLEACYDSELASGKKRVNI